MIAMTLVSFFFFFNDTATTEIYTLSLHDALPICVRSLAGEVIAIPPKALGRGVRYVYGGLLFGLGWALVGACPGPLFALVGAGVGVMAVACLAAGAGTGGYGDLRPRLPH